MSSTTPTGSAPPASTTSESTFEKIWGWVKKEVGIVEADLGKLIGSKAASELESAGKALLDSQLGPLAIAAIADATDVVTGQMSVSKAIDSLVSMAEAAGKSISKAAALQAIALAQNALPVGTTQTVTPVA